MPVKVVRHRPSAFADHLLVLRGSAATLLLPVTPAGSPGAPGPFSGFASTCSHDSPLIPHLHRASARRLSRSLLLPHILAPRLAGTAVGSGGVTMPALHLETGLRPGLSLRHAFRPLPAPPPALPSLHANYRTLVPECHCHEHPCNSDVLLKSY